MAQLPSPTLASAIAALTLGLSLPALAGNVTARAGKNPNFVEDTNPGASATANWENAAIANTTRTSTAVAITGAGASASLHHNANAFHRTNYQLWDLDTDTALETTLAQAALLDFEFELSGFTFVDAESLSSMNFSFNALLVSSTAESASGNVVVVYGPTGYANTGDLTLFGVFDRSFSLRHSNAASGVLNMSTAGLAANAAGSSGQLLLTGVTLLNPWSGSNLGVRLVETGEILTVSAIPEPGAWALLLAGLGVVGLLARRRAD